jgi:PAS domain S-box-containing protein
MSSMRESGFARFVTPAVQLGCTSLVPGNKRGAARSSSTAAALASSTLEFFLSRALATSPDAIVISDSNRKIINANAAAAELFGYTATELGGRAMRELYGTDEDWHAVRLELTGATTQAAPVGVTLRRKAGTLFDAAVSARAINGDDGAHLGFIETFCDSTADRQPTPKPEETYANTGSVRLARGIAHDFNNLLAIIGGNVQLARERIEDKASDRFLAEAEHACAMGARLTQRIMTFAEDRHFVPTEIDVGAMLSRQTLLLQSILGERITLAIETEKRSPCAYADLSGLENAILNLVLNARDAMTDGGQVLIRAALMKANGEIKIAVQDTGTGMKPRVQSRAFEPFFSTKAPGRGTGLGLASVYGFAKQSGGRAEIESTPGEGTTVSIFLPTVVKPAASR